MANLINHNKKLTLGERLVNWGKALSLFGAAAVACYGAFFKGEPQAAKANWKADQTWRTVRRQVNKQSEVINKMHMRMVYFQAKEETWNAAKIQAKLDTLQRQYDALNASKVTPKAAKILQDKLEESRETNRELDIKNKAIKQMKGAKARPQVQQLPIKLEDAASF